MEFKAYPNKPLSEQRVQESATTRCPFFLVAKDSNDSDL